VRRAGYGGEVRCPFCSADDDKVVDSRPADDFAAVRRRRECLACGRRFTTYERVEELPLVVVKRSGVKEPFDVEKLRGGIERAVAGSVIDPAAVEALAHEIEERTRAAGPEVSSEMVGLAVLERLRQLDPVSYVRFASKTWVTSSARWSNCRSRPPPSSARSRPAGFPRETLAITSL
jgi:transcriptional repressor NrdR